MAAHILILDDDLPTIEMMRMVLESEGLYQVTTVQTLFEDLSEIEQLRPDLILLDFSFGGHQLGGVYLQKLKQTRSTMTIPVIVCTAFFREEQEQDLLQKGISVLHKPFDIDEFLILVKKQLAHPA